MSRMTSYLLPLVIALCAASCDDKAQSIDLVVPTGIRGAIEIQGERSDGIKPTRGTQGNLTLEVPKSGVLKLKGPNPMFVWHILNVRDQNGTAIPVADSSVGADVTALRATGTAGGEDDGPTRDTCYIIGTEAEARAAVLARFDKSLTSMPVR